MPLRPAPEAVLVPFTEKEYTTAATVEHGRPFNEAVDLVVSNFGTTPVAHEIGLLMERPHRNTYHVFQVRFSEARTRSRNEGYGELATQRLDRCHHHPATEEHEKEPLQRAEVGCGGADRHDPKGHPEHRKAGHQSVLQVSPLLRGAAQTQG